MDIATLLRNAAMVLDIEDGGIPPQCVRCHAEWEDEGQGEWGDPVCESCPHHSCAHYDFADYRDYYGEWGNVSAKCVECGKTCLYLEY